MQCNDGREVVYAIEKVVHDFRVKYQKKPAGLVLGPREYTLLCDDYAESVKRKPMHATIVAGMITEFLGYPIVVSQTPGVSLLIAPDLAWILASN